MLKTKNRKTNKQFQSIINSPLLENLQKIYDCLKSPTDDIAIILYSQEIKCNPLIAVPFERFIEDVNRLTRSFPLMEYRRLRG